MAKTGIALLILLEIKGFPTSLRPEAAEHARLLRKELLHSIRSSLSPRLQALETEDQNLLLFQEAPLPDLENLLQTATGLHQNLLQEQNSYASRRICPCSSCQAIRQIRFHFSAYAGQVGFIRLIDSAKPHGKALEIVAQMAKDIPLQEDALFIERSSLKALGHEGQDLQKYGLQAHGDAVLHFPLPSNRPAHPPSKSPLPIPADYKSAAFQSRLEASAVEVFELLSNLEMRSEWLPQMRITSIRKEHINRAGDTNTASWDGKKVEVESIGIAGENAFAECFRGLLGGGAIYLQYKIEAHPRHSILDIQVHFPRTSLLQKFSRGPSSASIQQAFAAAIGRLQAIFV